MGKNTPPVVLQCQSLYKIFGDKPRQFLKNNGDKANYQKFFADNGYIIAVDDVSLEDEGEMFYGFVWF